MKKQITIIAISALLLTTVAFTAATSQQDKKDKKEKEAKTGKDQDKADRDKKEHPGNHEHKGQPADHDHKDGKHDHKDHVRFDFRHGFKWDHVSFKERHQVRKQEKVTICHKFKNDGEPAVTINVSSHAAKAHMDHGDVMGDCPEVAKDKYSDDYLKNRKDYFNNAQEHYEQVLYSRSILDYATARLATARAQLALMQLSKVPAADIERRQKKVNELEESVKVLNALVDDSDRIVVVQIK
jgi:HAMP domain-containing protein/Ni/Co efflux regulator RcnB